jgi:hypothetical protein
VEVNGITATSIFTTISKSSVTTIEHHECDLTTITTITTFTVAWSFRNNFAITAAKRHYWKTHVAVIPSTSRIHDSASSIMAIVPTTSSISRFHESSDSSGDIYR